VKLVVAVTGASGAIYARRTLELLAKQVAAGDSLTVDWVSSSTAAQVWASELGEPLPSSIAALRRWDRHDFRAPFASGSNAPDAVIVMPCSMSTLARVAHGGGDDLIARACEVALKERRRLILVVRETPLSLVHLRNMVAATEAGAVVLPAVPSFYAGIQTLEQAIDSVVARALDHAGVRLELLPRWGEEVTAHG
jgi:4-hydroxy-3-polyprenylbenzoate decarboxylase